MSLDSTIMAKASIPEYPWLYHSEELQTTSHGGTGAHEVAEERLDENLSLKSGKASCYKYGPV